MTWSDAFDLLLKVGIGGLISVYLLAVPPKHIEPKGQQL